MPIPKSTQLRALLNAARIAAADSPLRLDMTAREHGADLDFKSPIFHGPSMAATPSNFSDLSLQSAMANPERERVFDQIQKIMKGVSDRIDLPPAAQFNDPGRGLFDYTGMGSYPNAYLRRFDLPVPKRGMPPEMVKALRSNIGRYIDDTAAGRMRAGDNWYDMSPVQRWMDSHPDPSVSMKGGIALNRMSAYSAQNPPTVEIPAGFAHHAAIENGRPIEASVQSAIGKGPMPSHIQGAFGFDDRGAYGLKNAAGEITNNPKIFPYNEAKKGNLFAYPADTHEIQSLIPDLYVTPTMQHKGAMSMVAQELARRMGLPGPAPMMSSHWMEAAPRNMMKNSPALKSAHGLPKVLSPDEELAYWQQRYAPPFARIVEDSLVDRAKLLGEDPESFAAKAFRGDDFAGGGRVPKLAGEAANWATNFIRSRLPAEYRNQSMEPLSLAGSGRTVFSLGDDKVAKLFNPLNPRGLMENAYTNHDLEDSGLIAPKHWISPDNAIAVADRMNPDEAAAKNFTQPMWNTMVQAVRRESDGYGNKSRPSQNFLASTIHASDPSLSAMFERRGLEPFMTHDLHPDFYKWNSWMHNPSFNDGLNRGMTLTDEGAMLPNLTGKSADSLSSPSNYSTIAPNLSEVISDRIHHVTDARRRQVLMNSLAQAKEALSSAGDPDADAQIHHSLGKIQDGLEGYAGGGQVVRNFLRLMKNNDYANAFALEPKGGIDHVLHDLSGRAWTPETKKWVDSNLTNYLQRDFGTPNDPLAAVHAEGKLRVGGDAVPIADYNDIPDNVIKKVHAANVVSHMQSLRHNRGSVYQSTNPLVKAADLPAWLQGKLGSGETYHDIDPGAWQETLQAPTREMLDYLDQLPDADRARLNKLSVPDAFRQSHDYHQSLLDGDTKYAQSMEGTTLHKEYPTGYKWVKVESPEALNGEGAAMGHCVGSYCNKVEAGNSVIYSLRDENGLPHVTIEVAPGRVNRGSIVNGEQNKYEPDNITQINGKANPKPNGVPNPEYHPYIQDFIKSQPWGDVENPGRFDMYDLDTHDNASRLFPGARQKFGRYATAEDLDPNANSMMRDEPTGFADGGAVMAGVDAAARDAVKPSDSQADAGNYRKGHVRISGIPMAIENAAGSKRNTAWPPIVHHYGYIKGTVGKDKDHVDVFVKPGTPDNYDGPVHIVDQKKRNGHFDEHKVMLGFGTQDEAKDGYHANYEKGWDGMQAITSMDMPSFKTWVKEGNHQVPASSAKGYARGGMVTLSPDVSDTLTKSETENQLPSGLLHSMARFESANNPNAVSPKGATGLMQFMPETAAEMGFDPKDPVASAQFAGVYFRKLLKMFGNVHDALAAWNWGMGNVKKYGANDLPKETGDFIGRVFGGMTKMPEKKQEVTQAPIPARIAPRFPEHNEAMDMIEKLMQPEEEEEAIEV